MKNILSLFLCLISLQTVAQSQTFTANLDSIKQQQKTDSMRIAKRLSKFTPQEKQLTITGATLPDFKIKLYDSTYFYTNKIPKNKSVIVMLFNPTCEHCIMETMHILECQKKQFPNTVFVLATSYIMKDYLPEFIKKTNYTKQKNMVIGLDEDMATTPLFLYKGLPQILIYNKDKKLEDILYQDVAMEKLENVLRQPAMEDMNLLPIVDPKNKKRK